MRQCAFLLGVVVFFAGTAGAQARLDSSAAPIVDDVAQSSSSAAISQDISQGTTSPQLFAVAAEAANSAPGAAVPDTTSSSPQVSTTRDPVQGVFPLYHWGIYAGYTFVRFELTPSFAKNTNGLNVSSQYYIHKGGALGIDGEGVATFASVGNRTGKFWTGLGGVRYRFAAPRGLEIWVHGLAGGAKFVPQTALGGQTGFAYETGAGVDVGAFGHRRLAFRFAGDMVGTHFFSKNQYSPKISAGIVFKY